MPTDPNPTLSPTELAARLANLDARDADQLGRLRFLAKNPDLAPLIRQVTTWAENLHPDPRPVPPVSPLDVNPPVKPGRNGAEPVRGWTATDAALVERLAGTDKLTSDEVHRVAELWHTAEGDPSARLLVERILEPVRQTHEAALTAHKAAAEQWEARRPPVPQAIKQQAVGTVRRLIEATTTELTPGEADHRAKVYVQNGGTADPWDAA